MLDLHLDLQSKTAKRLIKILESYPDQETFAQNVIAQQVNELKRAILNLQIDLQKYEEEYDMSSDKFYMQFEEGKLDDREDFMIWSSLYELLLVNHAKLVELE